MSGDVDAFTGRIITCGKCKELGLMHGSHAVKVSVMIPTVRKGESLNLS